ncbi:MAG TPA: hypothetical protein VJO33_16170 [Gemmatimonadaceae bacterium]|nr:hypothetical protein [Gemmatimonadaceae bacterium]
MPRVRLRRTQVIVGVVMCLTKGITAAGQSVLLQIRPRVGDTLHLRLDQQTELTGLRRPGSTTPTSVTTTMRVYSRAIVERSVPTATYVRAVTDSVQLTSNDERALNLEDEARRSLEGRAMTLRISPDGTVSLADTTTDAARGVAEAVALMPAAFPRGPVEVGYVWTREMPVPAEGRVSPGGGGASAWLHTRFRLDSLARHGAIAYISMRGEMSPDPDAAGYAQGTTPVLERGTVTGWMLVDRVRGWLTESQFTIIAHSVVHIPGSDDTVMRFETRVTQRMKTVEKRQ